MKKKYILLVGVFAATLLIQVGGKAGYWSEWWLFAPSVLGLIILTWGVTQIHSQFFIKTECSFHPEGNEVVLTFDDGPHPQKTPEILALLKKYDAKAIFFCIGKEVDKYPQIAQEIIENGHEIGSHSYNHGYGFDFLAADAVKNELQMTEKAVKMATNRSIRLFRPPYGITNPNISKALEAFSYRTIGWNLRSLDTIIHKPEVLEKRVLKRIKPGSIILLHDTAPAVLPVLESLLVFLQNNGYKTRIL